MDYMTEQQRLVQRYEAEKQQMSDEEKLKATQHFQALADGTDWCPVQLDDNTEPTTRKLQVLLTDEELSWLEETMFTARRIHTEIDCDGYDYDTVADCTNKVWEAMEKAGWRLNKK